MANAAAGDGIEPALRPSRRQSVDTASALTPAGTRRTIGPTEIA